jgi:uncharacterized coiled-coil protein SlyX
MRTVHRLILASLVVLLLPSSARAGGWWTFVDTDRSTVAVGQRVKAEAEVLFSSIRAAREAEEEGRFYVYALRGLDYSMVGRAMSKPYSKDWWSLGNAEAVELGRVVLRVSDSNIARARASFTVPELAPATYSLMFCDAGCAQPLADIVPWKGFTVVADPATVKISARTTRLEERVARQAQSLATARAAGRRARAAVAQTESELRALEEQLRTLRRKVAEPAQSSRPSLWALAGWVLAGVFGGALAYLVLRRRSAKPPPHAFDGWQPSDEELRALIASHPSRSRPPRVRA